MIIKTENLCRTIEIFDGKITKNSLKNLLSQEEFLLDREDQFTISYYDNQFAALGPFKKHPKTINSSQFSVKEVGQTLTFTAHIDGIDFTVIQEFLDKDGVLSHTFSLTTSKNIFIDAIDSEKYTISKEFSWSIPISQEKITISPKILSLGQPIYNGTVFLALKSPVADTFTRDGKTVLRYHLGRYIKDFSQEISLPPTIVGAYPRPDMISARSAFFKYVHTFSRKPSMYITFNSWYDNMLDVDSAKIKSSFTEIHDGFRKSNLRDIDCYVLDDGWTDYKATKFWSVDQTKFDKDFKDESALTKSFNSKFGLWLGPRGGYTNETVKYARRLKKLGYSFNRASKDICTGDPKYIHDLGNRLIELMKNSNVEYFKLDGFALCPCPSRRHGHPVGGEDGIYFYTYLWEEWLRVFRKLKEVNPNIFINLTSYAHCSPFFLEYVSAIWMNNAGDMNYIGEGSDLDQCLNYRDSRYFDLQNCRQVQLPSQYIYNHEPNYGKKNYNPPLPDKTHRTVIYTDEEFEKYLYSCLMRGSGFVELYYSPSLMTEKKYSINAKVLSWAEANFSVISDSVYFGSSPEKGEVYGYIGVDKSRAIISFRNASPTSPKTFTLPLENYTFINKKYHLQEIYPVPKDQGEREGDLTVELEKSEVKIFEINYK